MKILKLILIHGMHGGRSPLFDCPVGGAPFTILIASYEERGGFCVRIPFYG